MNQINECVYSNLNVTNHVFDGLYLGNEDDYTDRETSIFNLVKSNQIWIVITFSTDIGGQLNSFILLLG